MPSPAPCLVQLRNQVNARYPNRNKDADGIMGDRRHRLRTSDHNLGNALDLTHSPETGFDAGQLAEALRRQMSTTPGGRVAYVIHNRKIASPIQGWKWRPYGGDNPHTGHVHISIVKALRYENRPWKLN